MLIDSIEAGARTVEPPSREAFDELVQRVIFTKMKQGQLDDSSLSLEDLRTLSTRITDTLVSVYHSRIRYPWQEERDQQRAARQANGESEGGDEGDVEHDAGEHPH
jgi:cyclic-di-AMP phosphodiesterase PgpH